MKQTHSQYLTFVCLIYITSDKEQQKKFKKKSQKCDTFWEPGTAAARLNSEARELIQIGSMHCHPWWFSKRSATPRATAHQHYAGETCILPSCSLSWFWRDKKHNEDLEKNLKLQEIKERNLRACLKSVFQYSF